MVFFRKYIKFLYILCLLVYLFIAHQLIQNKHAHFYPNGKVVHSHPLDKNSENPIDDHQHSKTEICFYQIANFDYFSHTNELQLILNSYSIPPALKPAEENCYCHLCLHRPDSRDPPFLFS